MKKERTIAVIDLKAFYSYVECVDRGLDPWSTPLVVADKERGKNTIVLSVTPYLKKRGVPSRLRINDLPKKYDYIYAAVGVHPEEIPEGTLPDIDLLKRLSDHEKVIAIGEIGLEYLYDSVWLAA